MSIMKNNAGEKDKKFNCLMVERALVDEQNTQGVIRRSDKISMKKQVEIGTCQNRNYDFTSDILDDFRKNGEFES